mmetsp:Transcript_37091/g.56105  ORF Transcript_37091/g.56105 Transcript_37091/m.56105 type:complete len:207 (+) Transcript_37091:435-1055(+)
MLGQRAVKIRGRVEVRRINARMPWALQRGLSRDLSLCHWPQVSVDREADVDESDEHGHHVSDMDRLALVPLGDLQVRGGHSLRPAQAHVDAEDHDGENVEEAPVDVLEDLELHSVDVTHRDRGLALVNPEEVEAEVEQGSDVDQVGRRAEVEGLGGSESELEQVDGHEAQQSDTGDGQVQLAGGHGVVDGDVPSSLQGHEDVEQGC